MVHVERNDRVLAENKIWFGKHVMAVNFVILESVAAHHRSGYATSNTWADEGSHVKLLSVIGFLSMQKQLIFVIDIFSTCFFSFKSIIET